MSRTDSWNTADRDVVRVEFDGKRRACHALQVESTPAATKVRVFMESNEETGGAWQSLVLQLPDGGTVEVRGSDFYHVDVRRPDGKFVGWLTTDPSRDEGEW